VQVSQRLAVYAGSFDPPTVGHVWMIEQGLSLFDRLTVAVGVNPDKRTLFSLEERLAMLRETNATHERLSVTFFSSRYLIDYARSIGAGFVLRGIRTAADYEFERAMRHINADLCPDITTVFLMPPRSIAEVSSSMVKGLVGPEGWEDLVSQYVAAPVLARLKALRQATR
jgi:pantetheine-phosphate adenylyltransferase